MKTKTDKKYEVWLASVQASQEKERVLYAHKCVPRADEQAAVAVPEPEEIAAAMADIIAQWGTDTEVAEILATTRIYFPGATLVAVRSKANPQPDVEDETAG